MKKLYFVRHGLSEYGVSQLFAGKTDTPLVKEGRRQAKKAGQKAKDLGIDCIVSSPLSRALETAQIIAKEIGYSKDKIITDELFIERDFGDMEGLPWSPGLDLSDVAGVESIDDILSRAQQALKFLHDLDAHNILVVSHGAIGRALRSHVLPEMAFHDRATGGAKDGLANAEIINWL